MKTIEFEVGQKWRTWVAGNVRIQAIFTSETDKRRILHLIPLGNFPDSLPLIYFEDELMAHNLKQLP